MANYQASTIRPDSLTGQGPSASTEHARGGVLAGGREAALAPAWHSWDRCVRSLHPCSSPCFLGFSVWADVSETTTLC